MAKAKVKVSVKSGKSGTKLAGGTVRVVKTGGMARISGKPMMFQTKAQLNVHIERGARPTKTQLRGAY